MKGIQRKLLFTLLVIVMGFGFGLACNSGFLPNGNYTVGGTVTGLEGDLELLNNGEDPILISSDGAFTFSKTLTTGAAYEVTVGEQPSGQTCTVTNGTGTMEKSNITNVSVNCEGGEGFTVSGTLSGLVGGKIFIQLFVQTSEGIESTSVETSSDGSFTFSGAYPPGTLYFVEVESTTVSNQQCIVGNETGTIEEVNITDVTVTCSPILILFGSNPAQGSTIAPRSNADSLCSSAADEQNLSCSNGVLAFISIDLNDEIQDMPANYGVPTNLPIYSKQGVEVQSDWASLLSGSILSTLSDAQVIGGLWWSGSTSTGALSANNCGNWQVGAMTGQTGAADATDSTWIESANSPFCSASTSLICLCY